MAVNRVKSVVMVVVCIACMGSCVPVIRRINEPVGVAGLVICAMALAYFLVPLLQDLTAKK